MKKAMGRRAAVLAASGAATLLVAFGPAVTAAQACWDGHDGHRTTWDGKRRGWDGWDGWDGKRRGFWDGWDGFDGKRRGWDGFDGFDGKRRGWDGFDGRRGWGW